MMKDRVRIELQPLGEVFKVERGTPLQDILFEHGVEFPCGGHGRCKGCRIKVLSGQLPATAEQEEILSPEELAEGWRLACRSTACDDLVLEIKQWEAAILTDETTFEVTPQEGLGIAVDLGTTTIVAQLVNLSNGHVLGVRSSLNPQAQYGGDIMSRVQYGVNETGRRKLEKIIHKEIGQLIRTLQTSTQKGDGIQDIVIVGNTVMHHLFSGIDIKPLSQYPFETTENDQQIFEARDLGWKTTNNAKVRFLPCLGGFVGSDILAGILATKMYESESLIGLIDLGTNGEIVVGNRDRMLCASTAAGPAFEGAKISMGMRAATGAVSEVHVDNGRLQCHVLGNVAPRGICGSGLVDAVAVGLDLGLIEPSGRLADDQKEVELCPPVQLSQNDVRELQLAKGAIAAGIRILLKQWGATFEDLTTLYLAGAFGNYINRVSAKRIGMINVPLDKVKPTGNTALLGAKLALFSSQGVESDFAFITNKMKHVSLAADALFLDIYIEAMTFPEN